MANVNSHDRSPTAFVCWAHSSPEWQATVLRFVLDLRDPGGVDADFDLFHETDASVNWMTYGPKGIEKSDFILLAVSRDLHRIWDRGPAADEGGHGAAREAAVIRGLLTNDPAFEHRLKVVILPGASKDDIPQEILHATYFELPDRFELLTHTIRGESKLVAPKVALAPRAYVEEVTRNDGPQVPTDIHDVADDAERAPPPDERASARAKAKQDILDAVAVKASPTSEYLYAELDHSVGAYVAANRRLALIRKASPAEGSPLEVAARLVAKTAADLNTALLDKRHAWPLDKGVRSRQPPPPRDVLDAEHQRRVGEFYDVACESLSDESLSPNLTSIRKAILANHPDTHAELLRRRYKHRAGVADRCTLLQIAVGTDAPDAAVIDAFAEARLPADGAIAASVLCCLEQSHLDLHQVEHDRSRPVGELLRRPPGEIEMERELLRRSIVLNTFTFAICDAMPWIFASEDERLDIQEDRPKDARNEMTPRLPMWIARQVLLLSLYRRAHAYRLLGDNQRAYNDLGKLQRLGRLARKGLEALPDDHDRSRMTAFVETLDSLAEYRVGELYRADHDYMQALVHLCRSHERIRKQTALGWVPADRAFIEVSLRMGKGKAFFEIGALKRSLKWHVNAWLSMLDLEPATAEPGANGTAATSPPRLPPPRDNLIELRDHLEHRKHEAEIDKAALERHVVAALRDIEAYACRERLLKYAKLPSSLGTLAADVLQRISHVLMVLRLRDDLAEKLLLWAQNLDDGNLLIKTGLLRCQVRGQRPPEEYHPMECWTSGASDVDQAIRAGEHLMLERLGYLRVNAKSDAPAVKVARRLGEHFMTHTDSINLRGAVQHRYLMRSRAEDHDPELAEVPAGAPYLEFVCLRRFGCFTPFMPRPAAVSAVGGGYLLRVCWPADRAAEPLPDAEGRPVVLNILVDPGEGVINNLYSAGLGIADVDMVIATHDHPDHITALDALMSLREEHARIGPDGTSAATRRPPMLILGNGSVVERYAFLNRKDREPRYRVHHIDDASSAESPLSLDDVVADHVAWRYPAETRTLKRRLVITSLPTRHSDQGGHDATGFVLRFVASRPDAVRAPDLSIAFMSDTSIGALVHHEVDPTTELDFDDVRAEWKDALASDIVVAHISDVPSSELRWLAGLTNARWTPQIGEFDRSVEALALARPSVAERLMHAMSMVARPGGDDAPQPTTLLDERAFLAGIADRDHLFLHGLLAVANLMNRKPANGNGGGPPQVLVIGEFREQLGSFRGTIAREINSRVFNAHVPDAKPRCVAFTADIGLRIRVGNEDSRVGNEDIRNRVLCSTCSVNNDRLDAERFHPAEPMREVCVKGDHEAMYWSCAAHDPGERKTGAKVFVEQMNGYDPFSAGGRYHG